jgi:exosortase/archaeosortase family protein
MPSKKKRTSFSAPRRVYTTRQVMEITEQRRLKEEVAGKENDPAPVVEDLKVESLLPVTDTPQITDEVKKFVSQVNIRPSQEIIEEPKDKNAVPVNTINGFQTFILLLTAFLLMALLKFPEAWANSLAAKFNSMVLYGSFIVFSGANLPCTIERYVLNTPYYKISLQGDLIAVYSLGLLVFFAVLFASIQKATWIKRAMIFASLVPLAALANVIRVLWACGLALNYGVASADRYFHGALVDFVFIFVVLGLIFFEFLSLPD